MTSIKNKEGTRPHIDGEGKRRFGGHFKSLKDMMRWMLANHKDLDFPITVDIKEI